MAADRPAIPRQLARDVKVEAGHRCAIPTCRATSGLEIHHIDDFSRVREHKFENLIYLCAVCHARCTSGEIDRKAMRQYKANLAVLNNRYGELERRVLEAFRAHPTAEIPLPGGMEILLMYLLGDGLIVEVPRGGVFISGKPAHQHFRLTPRGTEFVERWVSARDLE